VQDGLRIAEEAQPERADGQARRQVAQHRAQAQALEEGHGDDASGQQHDDFDEFGA